MIHFFTFLLLPLFGLAQDPTLTLEESVTIALKKNYDIQLAKNSLRIAVNNNSFGNAGFLPTIGLIGSTEKSIQDTQQEFLNGETQAVDNAERTFLDAGIVMEWTLFDGLKMFVTKDRMEEMQKMGGYELNAQIQYTIASVMKAFYNAALEQERSNLLLSTLDLSEERVNISKEKYQVGKASRLEYLQAQVDYNTDKSAFVRQQEVVKERKYELWTLLAGEGEPQFNLQYQLVPDESLILEEIMQEALLQNPELQYYHTNLEVAILEGKERERERLPELNFNMGYNYSNLNSQAGFLRSNQSTGVIYGLSARMNLFDGFNKSREIQNARIQAENASIGLSKVRTELLSGIQTAYLAYNNSLDLILLEEENLEVARENNDIAQERFRIGKSDPLEVREAQNNAVDAEVRYLEALNAAKQAEIELKRLSGMLLQRE